MEQKQWYYADQGVRFGPVDEARINELAHAGIITPDTLVWHDGMAEWTPLRQSGFTAEQKSPDGPPPLPPTSSDRYPRRDSAGGGTQRSAFSGGEDKQEAAQAEAPIDNRYLWAISCLPLFYLILLILLPLMPPLLILMLLMAPIALLCLDMMEISKHGFPFRTAYLWFLLIPLVYVVLRCIDTRVGYQPIWANLGASFVLSFFVLLFLF